MTFFQARHDMGVAMLAQFDHDPAATHFVGDCSGGAGAGKEYRKRNGSGAVYDDPRVAVWAGRFDELERERKRSQNARPS